MAGGGEYEPQDARNATGMKGAPDQSWRARESEANGRGEYEPGDSRNVTGQLSAHDERWRKGNTAPPKADGEPAKEACDVAEEEARKEE